jgi:hypothetical protein
MTTSESIDREPSNDPDLRVDTKSDAGERAIATPVVPRLAPATAESSDDAIDDLPAATRSTPPSLSPRLSLVTPSTARDQQELSAQMDRLSLEQALLDVEVANARVLDLTARLVEATQRISVLGADLDAMRSETEQVKVVAEVEVAAVRTEMASHQAHLDAQRSSTAYRWAAKVWNLRNAIRT